MKFIPASMAFWIVTLPLSAQEKVIPAWEVEIPVPIADGTPTEPAPKPEPIDFKVLNSRTQRRNVTEAPEMSDLPPIKGTINVTVQMVEDPGLLDPPPPLPALLPNDPAVIARLEEFRQHYRGTELVFLSATVYDDDRTLLRIYPNGNVDQQVAAWSNLNFNHFSGFSTFRVKDEDGNFRDFGLLMGIGSTNTARMRERLARHGQDYNEPEIPKMPDFAVAGPSFTVLEGDADSPAMDTLEQVHDLYRKEGARMEAAFHAREKAYEERKAYLLANPPKPSDITVRVWKRTFAQSNQKGQAR